MKSLYEITDCGFYFSVDMFFRAKKMPSNSKIRFSNSWILVNSLLLVLYLGFFHFCIGSSYWSCTIAGAVAWFIWLSICLLGRVVFLNRFEYWIHQIVGLDVLIEGFSPLHEGFGFYYCAAGFWLVFLGYHSIAVLEHDPGLISLETADGVLIP